MEVDPFIGTNLLLANNATGNPSKDWTSLGAITNTYHIYELGWLAGESRAYIDHSAIPSGTTVSQVPSVYSRPRSPIITMALMV